MEGDKERDSCWLDVPISDWAQYPLVSLLEVYKFYGEQLYYISEMLTGLAASNFGEKEQSLLTDLHRQKHAERLVYLRKTCEQTRLKMSVILLDRLIKESNEKHLTYAQIKRVVLELSHRIKDEISLILLLYIPQEKAKYYQDVNLFGSEVANRFPSSVFDIEEAGKCFATGRNTACVMHLMRVIEIGLRAVAKGLGIAEADLLPTWNAVIAKIESQMKIAANKRDPAWLKIEPFYREIPAYLFAIKNAWRNPSMHVQSSYDEERALDIFNAVRGFMHYLATELSE